MIDLFQAVPFLAGGFLGLTGVLLWGLLKARKARRRFWSHGKGQLLRPPGYTLSRRLADHWENLYWPLAALFIGGGIAGAVTWAVTYATWTICTSEPFQARLGTEGWKALTSASNFWPALLSLSVGLVGGVSAIIWGRFRFLDWMRQQYRLRTGLRGEQAVSEELQLAVRAGYYLFHDVPTDADCNIDHVLVGPGGVFALETKARSKPENVEGKDLKAEFDGNRISFTGGGFDTKAPRQAEAVAKWLTKELTRSTGRTVNAKPVVVLPGWYVPRNDSANVIVRNPEYFAKELTDAPRTINEADIVVVTHYLEKLCRDVAL